MKILLKDDMVIRIADANCNANEPQNNEKGETINMKTQNTTHKMKRNVIWILTIVMLSGLLGLASMSSAVEDTWTRKANMPTTRNRHSSCVVDGKIYVFGGIGGFWWNIASVELYDPATDTWTKKTDMPIPKHGFAICVLDGIIYVIAGVNPAMSACSIVEAYDPAADTWEKKANTLTARGYPSA
ncbi:hypothetical protein H8E77_08645, partial [bacterium]|nr:hypothetical protein [bacterium]